MCCYLAEIYDSIPQPSTTLRSSFREKRFEPFAVNCDPCHFRRAHAVDFAYGAFRANGRQQPAAAIESGDLTRSPHAQAPRRQPSPPAPHHIQDKSPVKNLLVRKKAGRKKQMGSCEGSPFANQLCRLGSNAKLRAVFGATAHRKSGVFSFVSALSPVESSSLQNSMSYV